MSLLEASEMNFTGFRKGMFIMCQVYLTAVYLAGVDDVALCLCSKLPQ